MIETQPYEAGTAESKALLSVQKIPWRPQLLWTGVMIAIFLAPYGASIWVLHQFVDVTAPVIIACFVFAMAVAIPFFIPIRRKMSLSVVNWTKDRMPKAAFDQRFVADEERFRLASALAETRCKWPFVHEIRETPTHLVLRTSALTGYAVPKSALGDSVAQTGAVEQIRSWWAARPPAPLTS